MIKPRSYYPAGAMLKNDYATMLAQHPEAFDSIIWPAKDSGNDEILTVNMPEITLLDHDERAQEYGEPILARAMIAPSQSLDFEAEDFGRMDSFNTATEAFNLLLSEPDLQLFSLVQWREDVGIAGLEEIERTVYIAKIMPMGKTLNAGNIYSCYPMPAISEKPATAEEKALPEDSVVMPPKVGIL